MHHLIELVPLLVGTEHKDALITDYVKHSYDLVKQVKFLLIFSFSPSPS